MPKTCESIDQAGWLTLREQLWPECARPDHLGEMAALIASPEKCVQFIDYDQSENALGFVEVSLRREYVNGTESSPVAYIEGIFVVPASRRIGVARRLMESAQRWAISVGCVELASDALIENTQSHSMHLGLGFEESERVVFYKKSLLR